MDRNEIFETLKAVAVEQLGIDEDSFTEAASFSDDLDADSLDRVELIMEMEDKFGIKIPDEEAQELKTVGQTIDYVLEKQG